MPLDHNTSLTHEIIGLAMKVHTHVGPGLVESVYERCLCYELTRSDLAFERQVELPLNYNGMNLAYG
jgi:GxxExxY protein